MVIHILGWWCLTRRRTQLGEGCRGGCREWIQAGRGANCSPLESEEKEGEWALWGRTYYGTTAPPLPFMVLQELERIISQFGGLVFSFSHLLVTRDRDLFPSKTKGNLMLKSFMLNYFGARLTNQAPSRGPTRFRFHLLRGKVRLPVHRERTVATFAKLSGLQIMSQYSDQLSKN